MNALSNDAYVHHISIYRHWVIGLLLLVLFSGCTIPTSRRRVIPEGVAGDPQELVSKLELLKPGMDFYEVFELLQIQPKTPGVRELVTAEEKQRILYGSAQLVGSPEELERFRERLGKHRIMEIKLIDVERSLTFDSPVSVLSTQVGPSFVAYLVFYEGRLNGSNRPTAFQEKETTRTYLSDLLGSLFRTGMGRGMDAVGP
jgi:hypothetical protein